MKKEKTTINLEPFNFEIINTLKGFNLKLSGATKKGYGKRHEINIEFTQWWISDFLKNFRKIIDSKRKELNMIESEFNKPNN